MDQDWRNQVQYGFWGILCLLLGAVNFVQLLCFYCSRQRKTALILVQKATAFSAFTFGAAFILFGLGPVERMHFMAARFLTSLGSIGFALVSITVVYQTTRNAYLAMYQDSENLSSWPFIFAFLCTSFCSLIASVLIAATNREIFQALGLLSFASFFVGMLYLGLYYYHQLVLHIADHQKIPDETSEWLLPYRRFIYLMSVVMVVGIITEVYLAVQVIRENTLYFERRKAEQYKFSPLAIPVTLAIVLMTWWAWRPLQCGEDPSEPTSGAVGSITKRSVHLQHV